MEETATPSAPARRRQGSVVLRCAALVLVSCWALTGALLGVWVLRSWWTTPVPDPVFVNFFGPGTVLVVGFQAVRGAILGARHPLAPAFYSCLPPLRQIGTRQLG